MCVFAAVLHLKLNILKRYVALNLVLTYLEQTLAFQTFDKESMEKLSKRFGWEEAEMVEDRDAFKTSVGANTTLKEDPFARPEDIYDENTNLANDKTLEIVAAGPEVFEKK
ncbi:unnamed protein product [Bursaphelenchus okinawaensis]|uniref:Uncharacterized protein n=1 Tax=Bursaphelenchus okinawaensis TaxID=465554 RepID=A0A811K6M3_9BILA|nr:unnamed protein product [Bursaphelenchus okinawaensis]CAG9092525.1 unnamed protein product [Bursaphelenchus okinawaensis]